MKKIILASTSPRRKELLRRLVDSFEIVAPSEQEAEYDCPEQTAQKNALNKGKSVLKSKDYQNSIIIACDTVVAKNSIIFGKPTNREHAFAMLKALQGDWHQVYSGVFVKADKEYNYCECSKVFIKQLSDEQIYKYIDSYLPYDKAGSYGIQDGGGIIKEYIGDYDNIVGLPLERIRKILRENGTNVKE